MKYVLINGVVIDKISPCGGILDVDKPNMTPDEITLLSCLNKVNSNGLVSAPYLSELNFEPMPFTGTVDAEFWVYFDMEL